MDTYSAYDESAQAFWSLYVKESEQHDKSSSEAWKSDMDSTLIFAGLFSATVTAFIIESYKLLQADPGDTTTALLTQLLAAQIVAASLNTTAIPFPTTVPTTPTFKPPASAVAVNVLWFLSLSCSLAAALCVTLVQKWTKDYLQRIECNTHPQRRAFIRGTMFSAIKQWKMGQIVEYIPTLLHLSLILFFFGLCIFLWNINVGTVVAVVAIVACFLCFYALATVAPLIHASAPYETPLSSLLWHIVFRQATDDPEQGPTANKNLSQARERLALPPLVNRESWDIEPPVQSEELVTLHRKIQAVDWVYDRISDDSEFQEFVGSIPGLLASRDGPIAWKIFLSRKPDVAKELEARIVRLLNSCSNTGYLDLGTRRARAMFCVDALLAMSGSSAHEHFTGTLRELRFHGLFNASWEDGNVLPAKFACLASILYQQDRCSSISLAIHSKHDVMKFRRLAAAADRALVDVDDVRRILEDVLQQPDSLLRYHKADIRALIGAYLTVVDEKLADLLSLLHEVFQLRTTCRSQYMNTLLSSYDAILPLDILLFESSYKKTRFDTRAHQLLAYLRLHGVYPPLADMPHIPPSTVQHLSATWFPLTNHIFSNGSEASKPSSSTVQPGNPIVPYSAIYERVCRELLPLWSLLDLVKESPPANVSVSENPQLNMFLPIGESGIFPFPAQIEGPFSLLASILEADIEDQGICGGLVELVFLMKKYPADLSTIRPHLNTLCAPMFAAKLSKESQILLVAALHEILTLKRKASTKASQSASDFRVFWYLLLRSLDHELPVAMAECAFGTTLIPKVIIPTTVSLKKPLIIG